MATYSGNSRKSPSGPVAGRVGIMAIATTAVALTAAATATGTFAGVKVGDTVNVNPRANLNGSLAIGWVRVVAADTIAVSFVNVGASTNTGAITVDVESRRSDI